MVGVLTIPLKGNWYSSTVIYSKVWAYKQSPNICSTFPKFLFTLQTFAKSHPLLHLFPHLRLPPTTPTLSNHNSFSLGPSKSTPSTHQSPSHALGRSSWFKHSPRMAIWGTPQQLPPLWYSLEHWIYLGAYSCASHLSVWRHSSRSSVICMLYVLFIPTY